MSTLRLLGITLLFAGLAFNTHAEKLPRWELGLGVGGLSMPDYRGSDEARNYLLPFPYFAFRFDRLKADRDGVRAKLFDSDRLDLNFSMGATPPVRSKKNRAREGMPDLKPMLEFGPSLDLNLWRSPKESTRIDLRLPLHAAFTARTNPQATGWVFSPRLNVDFTGLGMAEGAKDGWRLGLLAGPIFADRKQNAYFYSVTPEYSRTDRPTYDAHGGYSGMQFLSSLSRKFSRTWVGAYARWDSLHGASFENSPLVKRSSYFSAGFAVTWAFAQSAEQVDFGKD